MANKSSLIAVVEKQLVEMTFRQLSREQKVEGLKGEQHRESLYVYKDWFKLQKI